MEIILLILLNKQERLSGMSISREKVMLFAVCSVRLMQSVIL